MCEYADWWMCGLVDVRIGGCADWWMRGLVDVGIGGCGDFLMCGYADFLMRKS